MQLLPKPRGQQEDISAGGRELLNMGCFARVVSMIE